MARVCGNGHSVDEDYLKACPRCGSQLPAAPAKDALPPLAEAAPSFVSRAPRGLPMLVGGVVLALFGSLLSYAAKRGPAEAMGNLLLGLGGVLVLVGAVALGVKLGIEDARRE
ncbi:MAG: hypothetical protein ABI873_14255 [Marmoricola sp.]